MAKAKEAPVAPPDDGGLENIDLDNQEGKGANSVPSANAVPEEEPEGEEGPPASDVPAEQLTLDGIAGAHAIPGFDPTKHAVNADGTPRLKADGTFAAKRGRKSGNSGATSKANTTKGVIASHISPETYTMAAIPVVMLYEQLGMAIGEEWKMQDAEKDVHVGAWAAYFKSKGMVELSPGVFVMLVMGSYAVSRMGHENTQKKITGFFGKFVGIKSRIMSFFRV